MAIQGETGKGPMGHITEREPRGNEHVTTAPHPAPQSGTTLRGSRAAGPQQGRRASGQDGVSTGGCRRGEGGEEGRGHIGGDLWAALRSFLSPSPGHRRWQSHSAPGPPAPVQRPEQGATWAPGRHWVGLHGGFRSPRSGIVPSHPHRPPGVGAAVCFTVFREDGRPPCELQNLTYVYELPHTREAGHVLSACGREARSSRQRGQLWPPGPPGPAPTPSQAHSPPRGLLSS